MISMKLVNMVSHDLELKLWSAGRWDCNGLWQCVVHLACVCLSAHRFSFKLLQYLISAAIMKWQGNALLKLA